MLTQADVEKLLDTDDVGDFQEWLHDQQIDTWLPQNEWDIVREMQIALIREFLKTV